MRRGAPEVLVAVLITLLLGSYVVYTQRVVADLREEAVRSSTMFARVYRALSDPTEGASTQALLDLAGEIRRQGVPIVVTDGDGRPAAHANLDGVPDEASPDDPRLREWIARLDDRNAPVELRANDGTLLGFVHYGDTPVVEGLRIIPALQALTAIILLGFGVYVVRTRGHAQRERVWAGMARESAHQLGTPLSSLSGWIELLEERAAVPDAQPDPTLERAVAQMRADMDRLGRVANRFERIGREPRREHVDLRALVDRIAAYFRARVPTRTNAITLEVAHGAGSMAVGGDPVLLEWALEVLTKNAIDALSGRGGTVTLSTAREGQQVRVRVQDDGPGVPREHRARIFEPGFSTKTGGWGIGLSLAKRIVEEAHGGALVLAPSDRGAAFEIILREWRR